MRTFDKKFKETTKPQVKSATEPRTITDAISKNKTLSAQAKQIATMFKQQGSIEVVKSTPVQSVSPTPVAQKRPANNPTFSTGAGRTRNDSQSSSSVAMTTAASDELDKDTKFAIHLGNLPKGLEESDLRELFKGHAIQTIVQRCSRDSYHPSAEAYVCFNTKESMTKALANHHKRYRGKRVMITRNNVTQFFKPETAVIVKNLTPSKISTIF